jgi:hypothetical protein
MTEGGCPVGRVPVRIPGIAIDGKTGEVFEIGDTPGRTFAETNKALNI